MFSQKFSNVVVLFCTLLVVIVITDFITVVFKFNGTVSLKEIDLISNDSISTSGFHSFVSGGPIPDMFKSATRIVSDLVMLLRILCTLIFNEVFLVWTRWYEQREFKKWVYECRHRAVSSSDYKALMLRDIMHSEQGGWLDWNLSNVGMHSANGNMLSDVSKFVEIPGWKGIKMGTASLPALVPSDSSRFTFGTIPRDYIDGRDFILDPEWNIDSSQRAVLHRPSRSDPVYIDVPCGQSVGAGTAHGNQVSISQIIPEPNPHSYTDIRSYMQIVQPQYTETRNFGNMVTEHRVWSSEPDVRAIPGVQPQSMHSHWKNVWSISQYQRPTYKNFYLKAWLDYFAHASEASVVGAHNVNWMPRGHHVPIHVYHENNLEAVPLANQNAGEHLGSELYFWPNVHRIRDGRHFFHDATFGEDLQEQRMIMRYAGEWPSHALRETRNDGTDTFHAATSWRIPGASHIHIHHGNRTLSPAVYDAVGVAGAPLFTPIDPEALTHNLIMDFISEHSRRHGTGDDALEAFQLAACLVFSWDSDINLGGPVGGAAIGVTRVTPFLGDRQQIMVPCDRTIAEYFRPWCINSACDDTLSPVQGLECSYFMHLGRIYSHMIMFGNQWALKALSLNKLAHTQNLGVHKVHWDRMAYREKRTSDSNITKVADNAVAWAFGISVVGLVRWQFGARCVPNRGWSNYTSQYGYPIYALPIQEAWLYRMIPDCFMLPAPDMHTKWPSGKPYKTENISGPIENAWLARTMPPIENYFYLSDGGADYNAGIYASWNGDHAGPFSATNAELIEFRAWDKPAGSELPTAPLPFMVPRLPGPLDDFLMPGQFSVYNPTTRRHRAFAAHCTAGATIEMNDIHTQQRCWWTTITPLMPVGPVIHDTPWMQDWHLVKVQSKDGAETRYRVVRNDNYKTFIQELATDPKSGLGALPNDVDLDFPSGSKRRPTRGSGSGRKKGRGSSSSHTTKSWNKDIRTFKRGNKYDEDVQRGINEIVERMYEKMHDNRRDYSGGSGSHSRDQNPFTPNDNERRPRGNEPKSGRTLDEIKYDNDFPPASSGSGNDRGSGSRMPKRFPGKSGGGSSRKITNPIDSSTIHAPKNISIIPGRDLRFSKDSRGKLMAIYEPLNLAFFSNLGDTGSIRHAFSSYDWEVVPFKGALKLLSTQGKNTLFPPLQDLDDFKLKDYSTDALESAGYTLDTMTERGDVDGLNDEANRRLTERSGGSPKPRGGGSSGGGGTSRPKRSWKIKSFGGTSGKIITSTDKAREVLQDTVNASDDVSKEVQSMYFDDHDEREVPLTGSDYYVDSMNQDDRNDVDLVK